MTGTKTPPKREQARRRQLGLLLACALGGSSLACSTSDDSDDSDAGSGGAHSGTGGGAGAGSEATIEQPEAGKSICDDELPPRKVGDLSGKWAYVEVQTQVVVAPGFADPFRNLVITSELWDLTHEGSAVTGKVDVCDRYVRGGVVSASLSEALIESIPDFEITATYGEDGRFEVDRIYLLLGATMEDPSNKDALPTEEGPDVFDQEGDQRPGMTVRIQGLGLDGRVYNVQWSSMAPTGATVSEDRIEGLLDFDAKENVLGSDPPLIAKLSPHSSPHPEPCWSTFQMARLDDAATCDTVTSSFLTLFPDLASTNP